MQIVHKEGYAATSADLSALVTKLRRAQADVILHTGYNPDITLFLRQSKEAGLKFSALIGHGAGYGQIDKLIETFKDDVNLLLQRRSGRRAAARSQVPEAGPRRSHRRDGQALQGRDRRARRCRRTRPWASTRPGSSSPTCCRAPSRSTAASIPRRCARPRSRPTSPRAAPSRATASSSSRPATRWPGQNERSSPVVMQYVKGATKIAWPAAIKTTDPVLPLPTGPRLRALIATRRGAQRPPIRLTLSTPARPVALLAVSGLTKMFDGFTAVSNVSFDVEEGEILGLIGPNGSGKSTIFNCIAGMYVPTAGSIRFAGEEIAGLPANRVCHKRHRRAPIRSRARSATSPCSRTWRSRPGSARTARPTAPPAGARPRRRWASSTCPTDPHTTTDGLGAAALEEARAGPRARHAAQAAAGRREPQRPRSLRDGAGGRHAAAHPPRAAASPSSGSSTSWAC